MRGERLGRKAEMESGAQSPQVGFGDRGVLFELAGNPLFGRLAVAVVQPVHQPQREEVLAAIGFLLRQPQARNGVACQPRHRDAMHLVLGNDIRILERIGRVVGFLDVRLVELVDVDDQHAAALQVADIRLQRRRIHRNQRVDFVAGGEDVAAGKVELKPADPRQRSRRCANFGRKIGQCTHVVAQERRNVGELVPHQLHPVAAVAAESNDDGIDRFKLLRGRRGSLRRQGFRGGHCGRQLLAGKSNAERGAHGTAPAAVQNRGMDCRWDTSLTPLHDSLR
jgi:hypothetical protein